VAKRRLLVAPAARRLFYIVQKTREGAGETPALQNHGRNFRLITGLLLAEPNAKNTG
jgi:hypothetical protein